MQGQEQLVALAAAGAALLLLLIILLVVVVRRRRRGAAAVAAPRASWTSGLAKTRGSLTRRLQCRHRRSG